ncbi:MAG: ABC transporter ATP-binding protein [Bacteroidetes bacterium]|nr:MAG: ABC transporter ATP-binding protein [Bacteroidota bacterium]
MKIELHQFIPMPLAETKHGGSSIWRQNDLYVNSKPISLVISESGRGKSSLISSIYGIRKDYLGSILLDSENISNFSVGKWSEIRQKEISIVFQSLDLFPEISAFENIQLKNQLQNYKTEAEINTMLENLGMISFSKQSAGSLSFGQQQRIAIIRALCQPFSTLLLDEPFSHLDDNNIQIAWNMIQEESQKQQADIIITGLSTNDLIQADQIFYL